MNRNFSVSIQTAAFCRLLDRTGGGGEGVIGVGPDQPYRPYNQNQDHSQHHGILRNVLALVLEPDPSKKLSHTSSSLGLLWTTIMTVGRELVKCPTLCILWIKQTFLS
jgi:hypothetical protein